MVALSLAAEAGTGFIVINTTLLEILNMLHALKFSICYMH